jgi:hypothetical protein
VQVLNLILNKLKFGRVIKQGERTSRYIIGDRKGLELIIYLFNGNIVLPSKQQSFNKFLQIFNNKEEKKSQMNFNEIKPATTLRLGVCSNKLPSLTNN